VPIKVSLRPVDALMPILAILIASSVAVAADPQKTAVNERGLVADLYVPANLKGAKAPAIIVLGGSEGGLGAGAAHDAQLIASHGYVVLQLAYFDAPGLPKDLGLIPLEYFKTAIDWLGAHPGVDPHRLGIEGTSIGGEVALVVASYYPDIKAVAAAVPSSVVWPGISRSSAAPPSTFTLAGKPLPDLPYGWSGPATSIYDLYAKGLSAIGEHPDAVISVERINGPIILVCGGKDMIWPSCLMTEQITRRLKAHGFKYSVKQLKYAEAGHAAFGPPEPRGSDKIQKLAALGGTGAGNEAARLDDWPKVMAFMDAALDNKAAPAD
jgi:dienelactone hydrolase